MPSELVPSLHSHSFCFQVYYYIVVWHEQSKILYNRITLLLLQGVNRAFPFVSGDEADGVIEVQTPMLFQLVCLAMLGNLFLCATLMDEWCRFYYMDVKLDFHLNYMYFDFQVHSKNFNVGVQALMLLHKISSKNQIVSDRFYRALYSKLLLPAAISSSKVS